LSCTISYRKVPSGLRSISLKAYFLLGGREYLLKEGYQYLVVDDFVKAKIITDAGIYICYLYATTSSGTAATSVVKTANNKKAIKALRKAAVVIAPLCCSLR